MAATDGSASYARDAVFTSAISGDDSALRLLGRFSVIMPTAPRFSTVMYSYPA